jgi:hypothetical protein
MKKVFYSLPALIIGSLITYFILTDDFGGQKLVNPGAISLSDAYDHAMGHSDHLIKDFRKRTHGIMYDTTLLPSYIDSIKIFMRKNPLPKSAKWTNYVWRIGIYYGKGLRKIPPTGTESAKELTRLMTMFMPVLEDTLTHHTVDVFLAKKYHDKNDSTTPLDWDKNFTYFEIYSLFYEKYGKKSGPTDPQEIIFNSGSMFP